MKGVRDLPKGWTTVHLGDLALEGPTNGYSGPTSAEAAGTPTLRLSATSSGRLVLNAGTVKRLEETIPARSGLWLRPGDLLVQRSNTISLVGTAAMFDGPPDQYVYPDLMMRLRFPSPETASWVCRYMNGPDGRAFLSQVAAGSAGSMPKISGQKLRGMPVPLPSLAEQRRIAEILDRADALRAKRRAALAQVDGLTQAFFLEMFGDPETNPKGWKLVPVAELAEELRYGTSEKSTAEGAPVLRIPNVVAGIVDYEDLKYVAVEPSEFARLRLVDGDLLFVRTNGNPDYVGRCAVFDQNAATQTGLPGDRFVFASYLIRARLSLDTVSPVYLREFMLSRAGRKELRARAKTSAGQFNVNAESLRAIPVPLPPVPAQRAFARRAAAVDKLNASHRASLAHLDALFASLQHRAFRGEL